MSDLKRGNILWESSRMFLPEHKQALLQRKEQLKKVEKPLLDDQELEQINMMIIQSLHDQLDVVIVYWKDGFFEYVSGIVERVNIQQQYIQMIDGEEKKCIPIGCVKSVEIR